MIVCDIVEVWSCDQKTTKKVTKNKHCLQVVSTNGLEMAECILKNNDITKFDILPVGGAIFPTMSFFNHSCYPNALRLGYQNYQVQHT